jgi:hypothetical protein
VVSFVSLGVNANVNALDDVTSYKTTSSPLLISTTSTSTALHGIRGGGFMSYMFGIGKQSAADVYRETLEEQVLLLDRQLRQARDEMAKLRKQFITRTAIPSSFKVEMSTLALIGTITIPLASVAGL